MALGRPRGSCSAQLAGPAPSQQDEASPHNWRDRVWREERRRGGGLHRRWRVGQPEGGTRRRGAVNFDVDWGGSSGWSQWRSRFGLGGTSMRQRGGVCSTRSVAEGSQASAEETTGVRLKQRLGPMDERGKIELLEVASAPT
jgi:hypothetical protein